MRGVGGGGRDWVDFRCRFWLFCPEYPQPVDPSWEFLLSQKKTLDARLISNFIYTDERRLCDEYEFTTDTEDASFTKYTKSEKIRTVKQIM